MKAVRFVPMVGRAIVVAALVAGCAGSLPAKTPATTALGRVPAGSKTFRYTGKEQSFTVPSGVKQIRVVANGAESPSGHYYTGGTGGLLKATIDVSPGEKLAIFVGGAGAGSASGAGGTGGFNGGGAGGKGLYGSGGYADGGDGGGGASDVRQDGDALTNRVIVSGGGGGAGGGRDYGYGGAGGNGGGKIGLEGAGGDVIHEFDPEGGGGKGGRQRTGGAGGFAGQSPSYRHAARGHRGILGDGGRGGCCNSRSSAGGGGGSSWVEPSASGVKNISGGASLGNGQIKISW